MQLTQYLQGLITSYLISIDFPAAPAGLELALSSTDPIIGITEVGTRQAISLTVPVNGKSENTAPIAYNPVAGSITHIALFVAGGGEMLMAAELPIPNVQQAGGTFSFDAGDIEISFSDAYGSTFADAMINWMRGDAMPAAPAQSYMEISRGAVFNPPQITDGYAAQELEFVTPFPYAAGTGTTVENKNDVLFPRSQTTDWGVITHVAVTDGTNPLFMLELSASDSVAIGETTGFANNSVSFVIQ